MARLVTVIITTRNEEQNIDACLLSIQKQTYPSIETIVVDNNSSDKTKEVAQSLGARVYNKGPERSAQRNFGAGKAKGAYLLFLDADMELTPKVIEECVQLIEKLRITNYELGKKMRNTSAPRSLGEVGQSAIKQSIYVALVIPEQSFGIGFWAKCKALERSYYLNVPWIESARFFERKAFQKAGGYDETLTGPEDFEFPQRMKQIFGESSVGRIDAYIRHNEGTLSLAKTLRKKYYYGKKMAEYRKKPAAKGYFEKQSSLWRRYSLFLGKPSIVFRHPVLFVGMIIMKTMEMGAAALGALGL